MEIADALYGVSMWQEGVSAVVGHRTTCEREPVDACATRCPPLEESIRGGPLRTESILDSLPDIDSLRDTDPAASGGGTASRSAPGERPQRSADSTNTTPSP